jgi:hypothetical protein
LQGSRIANTITTNKGARNMTIIRCNNCFSHYEEEDINITECSKCNTDEYLMELEEEKVNNE